MKITRLAARGAQENLFGFEFIYLYTKADRYKLPGPTARSQKRTHTNHFSMMQNNTNSEMHQRRTTRKEIA